MTGASQVTDLPPVAVLVVDDDETKRFLLTGILAPLGFSIVEADSGKAALGCLLAQDFAVILLDARMPGLDGFETAALIRTRRRSEATPILLTTASTRDEIMTSGMHTAGVEADLMFASLDSTELRATVLAFGNLFRQAQQLALYNREAQRADDRWRLLTGAVPVGIFQTDLNHQYTYTNPQWSEITGISAAAALGQDWRASGGGARLVAGTSRLSHRIEISVAGAGPKVVLLSSAPMLDGDGAILGWAGSLTDETPVDLDGELLSDPAPAHGNLGQTSSS